MNNKELEAKAIQYLVSNLTKLGYECTDVHSHRNKGWDLEAKKADVFFPIEVKSTRAERWSDTNLRFTWQTICSAYSANYLNQLVLAVVVNADKDNPTVQYHRFSDVAGNELYVEPTFLIQLNRLKKQGLPTYGTLEEIPAHSLDMMQVVRNILKTPISEYVNISHPK